jgi:protein tyrosine/serine phosphatase
VIVTGHPQRTWLSVWLLLECGALAGCGLRELDDFAPLMPADNFHVIEPGQTYRSAQLDAESFRLVIEVLGIQTVVNLRGENEDELWYQREKAAVEDVGATLVDIRMSASELPSRENLLLLYDTFLEAEYPILMHCQAGADRAGAAAAIWRMVVLGEPRELAALQLSPVYGHFLFVHPEMDYLVAIFEPDRDWIENEYPAP